MLNTGTSTLITHEMNRYQLNLVGVTESRWSGSGRTTLNNGYTIFFSGDQSENPQHTSGTAFILNKKASKSVVT